MKHIFLILLLSISLLSYADNDKKTKDNPIIIEQSLNNVIISFTDIIVNSVTIIDDKNNIIFKEESCANGITTTISKSGTYFIRIETKDGVIIQRLIVSMK